MTRYRVVRDNFAGFEVQSWRWWFPFWIQCCDNGPVNTFSTLDRAIEFIKRKKSPVVYSE